MRVLLLGGSGKFGLSTAKRLLAVETVGEVSLAGRNPEALNQAAQVLGARARAVPMDVSDRRQVADAASACDIVVNAAGPEWLVCVSSLEGAIAAGRNYCDIGAHGPTTEAQLRLDAAARARGVTALVGMYTDPGLDNLLAVHACSQLDCPQEIRVCFAARNLWQKAQSLRDSGRVDMSLQVQLHALSRPVRVYESGVWTAIDPLSAPQRLDVPQGGTAVGFPIDFPEMVTLPRYLRDLRRVSCVIAYATPQLTELAVRQAQRIARDGAPPLDAARSILAAILSEPDRWLEPGYASAPAAWRMWVEATGRRSGRRCRYSCWPGRLSGVDALAVAVGKLLSGEVGVRGVVPPEACFEPLPFLREVGACREAEHRSDPLVGERFEWLAG